MEIAIIAGESKKELMAIVGEQAYQEKEADVI